MPFAQLSQKQPTFVPHPSDALLRQCFSFRQFQTRTDGLVASKRGEPLERLTQVILSIDPKLSAGASSVIGRWNQQEWKDICAAVGVPVADNGIDLLAVLKDDTVMAVQCKNWKNRLNWKHLSTFTGLGRKYSLISRMLAVHTHQKWVSKTDLVDDVSYVGADHFLSMGREKWVEVHNWLNDTPVRPRPFEPREDQEEAIEAAYQHYIAKRNDRGRYISATGTGKSLCSYWMTNRLLGDMDRPKGIVLIAVPSLALANQMLAQ